MPHAPCVMIVAVEPSADALGAALARALRDRLGPRIRFVGVGGPALAAEGLASPFDPASLAVIGAFNALGAYPAVLRRARQTAGLAQVECPDVAVLIDAWGFNLRVARALKRGCPSLPVIKYVAPQVWATRPGRARTLAQVADLLLTIHSFDAPYFEAEGLRTRFVGNPTLNRDFSGADPERFRAAVSAPPGAPTLLLLPGSRGGEVRRLMPPFEAAAARLRSTHPDLKVALAAAEGVAGQVRSALSSWRDPPVMIEGESERLDAMRGATAALACSGTVTTELALAGCPMVVAYRLDPLTYLAARALIRTPYITLFNVAAGAAVAPERIQGACNGKTLAADLARLLDDPAARRSQIEAQLRAVAAMRGGVDEPIEAAADEVFGVISRASR